MVAKFLDDNKPKIQLKRDFVPFQTSSILFNFIQFVKLVESERTVSKFRKKENENLCVVFTNSMKWARETRKVHVAVMQRWLKSVMHVQICRFANINLRIFCRSRYRRRGRCLGSVLL